MDTLQVLVDEVMLHMKPRMRQDDVIEPELVAQYIRDARAATILREYAGKRSLNGFVQTLNVAITPIEWKISVNVNGSQKTYPMQANSIYRIEMPRLISGIGRYALHYFGSADLQNTYDVIYEPLFETMHYMRWGGTKPVLYANHTDTYIYVPNNKPLVATIVGIFGNPEDVYGFTWDMPYPIPTDAKESMTYIVRQKLMEHLQMPIDIVNDNVNQTTRFAGPVQRGQQEQTKGDEQ